MEGEIAEYEIMGVWTPSRTGVDIKCRTCSDRKKIVVVAAVCYSGDNLASLEGQVLAHDQKFHGGT